MESLVDLDLLPLSLELWTPCVELVEATILNDGQVKCTRNSGVDGSCVDIHGVTGGVESDEMWCPVLICGVSVGTSPYKHIFPLHKDNNSDSII